MKKSISILLTLFIVLALIPLQLAEAQTSNLAEYQDMTRAQLAQEILNRYYARPQRILLPEWSANATRANGRSQYMNLRQAADGQRSTTRHGSTYLCRYLLKAILVLSDRYPNHTLKITAIAGHVHNSRTNNSLHYSGQAADFQWIGPHRNSPSAARTHHHPVLTPFLTSQGFRMQNGVSVAYYAPIFHIGITGWSASAVSLPQTPPQQPQQPAPTATIQYRANGAGVQGLPASHTANADAQGFVPIVIASTRPTRDGYTFLGWRQNNHAMSALVQPGQSFQQHQNIK